MKREMDTIQFESRTEVVAVMDALSNYVKQNPQEQENAVLKEFYGLLDVMEMTW